MKPTLYIFILFCSINLTFGQKIEFKPIFINQCDGKITNKVDWVLLDSNNNVVVFFELEDVVALPYLGNYKLYETDDFFQEDDNYYAINIEKQGLNTDTFYTKKIELLLYVSNPHRSGHYSCGHLASGTLTDYYYNGNIRLIGTFKDGQPIDTLKEFYTDGAIKEIDIPKTKQRIIYFRNGNVKFTAFNRSKRKRHIVEYYENGNLKSHQVLNEKNGQWRSKR